MGRPMLMGRKTWESLPGLLPGRRHLVLTRDPDYRAVGCELVHSLAQAVELAGGAEELMVIGGAEIYRLALPQAARLQLTLVHTPVAGDAWFPEFDPTDWREVWRERHEPDERHALPFSFVTLKRIASLD